MTTFVLYEYDASFRSSESVAVDGTVMVFDTHEDAADMAMWMLEGGVGSLVDGEVPVVAVVALFDDGDCEHVGWVENLGGGGATHHFGDVDDCRRLWSVERAKREIVGDVRSGRVPATVDGFGVLHDFVDANEYGGLCDDGHGLTDEAWLEWGIEVQDALDVWIRNGGLREETK